MVTRTEGEQAILAYLDILAQMKSPMAPFFQEHARFYTPAPKPRSIKRGPAKQCFWTCQEYVLDRPKTKLVYVEGYGISGTMLTRHPGGGFAMTHAWLVDPEGRVVDLTWPLSEHGAYYGVPFLRSYVLRKGAELGGVCPLIDRMEDGFKLVRGLEQGGEVFA